MIIDIIIFGLIWTAIYSLIGLGFSLIFGVAKIMNLAHGAFFMIACYIVFMLTSQAHLGLLWAALGAVIITVIISLIIYWGFIRQMRSTLTQVLIITLALAMFLEQIVLLMFGPEPRYVPSILTGGVHILGVRVTEQQLLTFVIAIILILVIWLLLTKTNIGRIIRAVSQDAEMASMLGVDTERVYLFVMGLSAALASTAGILVAPFLTVTPAMGWSPILVAFTIVVLGGLGNIWGTLAGAAIVAFAEMFTSYAIHPQLKDAVTFTILILALIFKPNGLFSREVN
ncbi:MAG: hypothetical protein BAA01_11000 [Bacillus thermozeamaize]|jgi:branched-chain amino acid transport system permease protein|uniref:Branched-chain amino acid ABC transporter permease n=1 Tax=Bacillus thermozeamaize TaxID=230954 RepID=A0A1Y3PKS7_9BACI|nr:MAG: hypothetical protein BAA01_11000 [Bacillus thermozeamaize]